MEKSNVEEIKYRLEQTVESVDNLVKCLEEIGFDSERNESVIKISNKVDTLGMEITDIVWKLINKEK